ncbi:MAG: nucleotidyltransferase domain-containing protein [Candidatus Aminicenantes bacterium]|nr:nucleotidyltransferase domain-containing protein [Candidatus Aminicenantes bacterium]
MKKEIKNSKEFNTLQLSQRRQKYLKLLKKSLAKAVKTTIKMGKGRLIKISLFGSYPKRADLFSDLDLLIIMESEKPFLERLKDIYGLLRLPVDADILCYTPKEVKELKQHGFLRQILKREIVLYEEKSQGRRKKVA